MTVGADWCSANWNEPDDAKVPATAPQRPEQVGMVAG